MNNHPWPTTHILHVPFHFWSGNAAIQIPWVAKMFQNNENLLMLPFSLIKNFIERHSGLSMIWYLLTLPWTYSLIESFRKTNKKLEQAKLNLERAKEKSASDKWRTLNKLIGTTSTVIRLWTLNYKAIVQNISTALAWNIGSHQIYSKTD